MSSPDFGPWEMVERMGRWLVGETDTKMGRWFVGE
jgi:hypothetical protein